MTRRATALALSWIVFSISGAEAAEPVGIYMQPPTKPASASASTDKAKLTDDWHCTSSIDGCTASECTPGGYGYATCSALDWNDAADADDDAYFRSYGLWPGGLNATKVHGFPSGESITTPCYDVHVAIRDMTTNTNKGYMWYEHITLDFPGEFSIWIESTASWTNKRLGNYVYSEKCAAWSGAHVHEMNNLSSNWRSWNTSVYNNGDNLTYEVDDWAKWTREIGFDVL